MSKIRLQEINNTIEGNVHNVFQTTLPKWMIYSLGWKNGDVLNAKKTSNGITIKRGAQ